jgi:GxxExxY protein
MKRLIIRIASHQEVPLEYKNKSIPTAYPPDLPVENKLIAELKTVEAIHDISLAQVHTYLKLTNCWPGLLLNFNVKLMKLGD